MKTTLAVAAREIAERKILFLGALVAGLLALGFPLLPVFRGNSPDARSVAVLLLAAAIAVGFPIVFGASILASDIAQKRLSFYFSRPLPAFSIWAGKLLAALLISIGCAFLAAAPVFLVVGEGAFSSQTGGLGSRGPLVLALPGALLLLLLAHAVASMARLKSAWVALDFILAVVFAAAIALSIRILLVAGFRDPFEMKHSPERLIWWLASPLIATLLVASYVQVADGRTDARRSHGALSATLWGLTAVFAAILGGFAWWVSSAAPKDLETVASVQTAPHGTWVSVLGPVRGHGSTRAAFLHDTESGRFFKRPVSWEGGIAFSAGGSRAAWAEEGAGFSERRRESDLFVADLSSATKIETGLTCKEGRCRIALSPSGIRLAVSDGGTLFAYDISGPANPKQIAAVHFEAGSRTFVFVDDDTVRIFPRFPNAAIRKDPVPRDFEIEEISLASKKSLVTGRFEHEAPPHLRPSADGRYLIGTRDRRLTLHDGRTGALLATLSEDLDRPGVRFLSGGRIAVAGVAGGRGQLKIFLEGEEGRTRTPTRTIDLGPAGAAALGGEIARDRVAVSLKTLLRNSSSPASRSPWKLAFVDVSTGAVSSGPDGLFPADRFSQFLSPGLPPAEAGSPASRLFLDASGALVRLDPATLKQEVLLGGRR